MEVKRLPGPNVIDFDDHSWWTYRLQIVKPVIGQLPRAVANDRAARLQ